MVEISPFIRIFEGNPSDEFVTKRHAAVKDIAQKFSKPNTTNRLMEVANAVCVVARSPELIPAVLSKEIETSLVKASPSFVAEGHTLEMATCALLAALTVIETNKGGTLNAADFMSMGIWSGLSLQPGSSNELFERLRMQLLDTAKAHILKSAKTARIRKAPADLVELAAGGANLAGVVDNLGSIVTTLTLNAAVDREEIDLLWWSISGWSQTLGRKYSDAEKYAAALALGIDASKHLRRMPDELHKALVLRRVPEGDPLPLTQIVTVVAPLRQLLAARFMDNTDVAKNPEIFPLLNALTTGDAGSAGDISLSMHDLALRALLEGIAVDVITRRGL